MHSPDCRGSLLEAVVNFLCVRRGDLRSHEAHLQKKTNDPVALAESGWKFQ